MELLLLLLPLLPSFSVSCRLVPCRAVLLSFQVLRALPMGIVASRHLSAEKLQEIQNESGFSPLRIDYLLGQYQSLERDTEGRVLRSELLKVPPVAAHPLADRLVDVYLYPSLGFRHFMHGLSRFRRSEPLQRKLQSLLGMYDADGDGLLSADQCDELLGRLPATRRELRSMRWKLKKLMAAQALEQREPDREPEPEPETEREREREREREQVQQPELPQEPELQVQLVQHKGCINCDDLGYITRDLDLDQSLSLRFN